MRKTRLFEGAPSTSVVKKQLAERCTRNVRLKKILQRRNFTCARWLWEFQIKLKSILRPARSSVWISWPQNCAFLLHCCFQELGAGTRRVGTLTSHTFHGRRRVSFFPSLIFKPVRGKLSQLACKYSVSYPAFFQRIRNRERVGRFWFRAKGSSHPSQRPLHQRLTFPWFIARFSLFSTKKKKTRQVIMYYRSYGFTDYRQTTRKKNWLTDKTGNNSRWTDTQHGPIFYECLSTWQ